MRPQALAAYTARIRRDNARFQGLSKAEKRVAIATDVIAAINARRIKPAHCTYFSTTASSLKDAALAGDKIDDLRYGADPDSISDEKLAAAVRKAVEEREAELRALANKDLSEIFAEMPSCDVCAIGSMFVCSVERADKLKVKDVELQNFGDNDTEIDNDAMMAYLGRYFSQVQLKLIENAFEESDIHGFGGDVPTETDPETGEAKPTTPEGEKLFALAKRAREFNNGVRGASKRMRRVMQNIVDNRGTFKP